MYNKKNILKSATILIFHIVIFNACNLAPGSYPYAERYELDISEEVLIETVHEFKNSNSKLKIPNGIPLIDGRVDSLDHWYHFYFYDEKRNQIIYAWVRGGRSKSRFSFVGIYDSNFPNRWKFVNKDFSQSENDEGKKRFENDILNPVKKILK